jgi:hypothetical protein
MSHFKSIQISLIHTLLILNPLHIHSLRPLLREPQILSHQRHHHIDLQSHDFQYPNPQPKIFLQLSLLDVHHQKILSHSSPHDVLHLIHSMHLVSSPPNTQIFPFDLKENHSPHVAHLPPFIYQSYKWNPT